MRPIVRDAFRLGYRVTDDGRVMSPRGRVLALGRLKYPQIGIYLDGRVRRVYAHHLAAYCFFGEAAFEAQCVRHLNANVLDLSRTNIRIGTYLENALDKDPAVRLRAARIAARSPRRPRTK